MFAMQDEKREIEDTEGDWNCRFKGFYRERKRDRDLNGEKREGEEKGK